MIAGTGVRAGAAADRDPPNQDPPVNDVMAPDVRQAAALLDGAAISGMRFEAYLPPSLATWVLRAIAVGTFRNPSEAVFVSISDSAEMERHPEARRALLRCILEAASAELGADPDNGATIEAVFASLRERARDVHEPVVWRDTASQTSHLQGAQQGVSLDRELSPPPEGIPLDPVE